jgi:hypothetical protein
MVRERIAQLRRYRWSSYRAYAGLSQQPAWLECERVLELGGGSRDERRRKYREYVESANGVKTCSYSGALQRGLEGREGRCRAPLYGGSPDHFRAIKTAQ